MSRLIVTDLTKFANREFLCTAGIDAETGQCVRPLPYLKADRCKELNLLPGAILAGEFVRPSAIDAPHIEDMNYQKLTFHGQCESGEFQELLEDSSFDSIEAGFEVCLEERQKHIPRELLPQKSLITIRVAPHGIRIVQDQYDQTRIKAHITDASGRKYNFLSVTDLGLHSYAANHYQKAGNYAVLNNLIHSQEEVFVRIGLSRFYEAPNGRAGYWMQVNGIYSFPDFFEAGRQYE